jgi:sensor histidine kinase YesM
MTNRNGPAPFGNAVLSVLQLELLTFPIIWMRRQPVALIGWSALICFAAGQWFVYDWTHGQAERFRYYIGTCFYFLGVLTAAGILLARRWPLESNRWRSRLLLHLAASMILTVSAIVAETAILWSIHRDWPFLSALRHCFTYHTQVGLLAYWFLLGAVYVYGQYDRSRQHELHAAQLEAQLGQAQLAALRSQLQPHFLFNTLQAAHTLIYDDPKGAEDILLSLSELLRISLQMLSQQEIPLGNEISFLKHYAAIQQRRFQDRLRFTFEIEERCEYCAVPALFLQPLLENSVHHGIGERKQCDVILVQASARDCRLHLGIQNQIGVLDAEMKTLLARGLGLANTMARLERMYGAEHSFQIRNLSPEGVAISISIPFRPLRARTKDSEMRLV